MAKLPPRKKDLKGKAKGIKVVGGTATGVGKSNKGRNSSVGGGGQVGAATGLVVSLKGKQPQSAEELAAAEKEYRQLLKEFAPEYKGQMASGAASRKKKNLTQHQVARAIIENDGYLAKTAFSLGIHYHSLQKHIKESPYLQDIYTDCIEGNLDLCESVFKRAAAKGNLTAAIFYAKCKGKHRGWIEDAKDVPADALPPIQFNYKLAERKPDVPSNGQAQGASKQTTKT